MKSVIFSKLFLSQWNEKLGWDPGLVPFKGLAAHFAFLTKFTLEKVVRLTLSRHGVHCSFTKTSCLERIKHSKRLSQWVRITVQAAASLCGRWFTGIHSGAGKPLDKRTCETDALVRLRWCVCFSVSSASSRWRLFVMHEYTGCTN